MQSKVHTNCLLGLVKKCVSVWYFLVYTVSANVVVAVVVVVEYNCLFTLRTNLLLTFCCSLLKFRLKIHLILSSFFFLFFLIFFSFCVFVFLLHHIVCSLNICHMYVSVYLTNLSHYTLSNS